MSEFTPGPWEWDSDGHIYREPWTEDADPAVCKVNVHVSGGEANAHLIAAAPDLLECLHEVAFWCKQDAENEDGYPTQEMMDARVEVLQIAINRATNS